MTAASRPVVTAALAEIQDNQGTPPTVEIFQPTQMLQQYIIDNIHWIKLRETMRLLSIPETYRLVNYLKLEEKYVRSKDIIKKMKSIHPSNTRFEPTKYHYILMCLKECSVL